jgi:ribosomal protein S1
VVEVGEELEVMIKSIDGEKIALTRKLPGTNPWDKAAEQIKIGDVVTGKVARMTTFGAFVEVLPGVDALLHVSQISNKRVEKPEDVLTLGQEITAKVVDFKLEEKKISLSMRALIDNGQAEASDDTDAE